MFDARFTTATPPPEGFSLIKRKRYPIYWVYLVKVSNFKVYREISSKLRETCVSHDIFAACFLASVHTHRGRCLHGGRKMHKEDPRRWNNLSVTLICSYRSVYMQKFWSVWLPSREGSKGGGRQSQKCNLGPSALSTGDLSAKKIRDTDRCNPLPVNRIQNTHLALAVFRLLRSSSLYSNGALKISVD